TSSRVKRIAKMSQEEYAARVMASATASMTRDISSGERTTSCRQTSEPESGRSASGRQGSCRLGNMSQSPRKALHPGLRGCNRSAREPAMVEGELGVNPEKGEQRSATSNPASKPDAVKIRDTDQEEPSGHTLTQGSLRATPRTAGPSYRSIICCYFTESQGKS